MERYIPSTMIAALLLMLSQAGCPKPEVVPLPGGPPPEYEAPRSYNPDKDIDGKPLSSAEPPAPHERTPPPPAPTNALPEDDDVPDDPPTPVPTGSTPAPPAVPAQPISEPLGAEPLPPEKK